MSTFDHTRGRRHEPGVTAMPEARLAPGVAILAIGSLALLSWALLISIGMALRAVL